MKNAQLFFLDEIRTCVRGGNTKPSDATHIAQIQVIHFVY